MLDDKVSYVQLESHEYVGSETYVTVGCIEGDGFRKYNGCIGLRAGEFAYPLYKKVDPMGDIRGLYLAASDALEKAQKTHLEFLNENAPFKVGQTIEWGHDDQRGVVTGYNLRSNIANVTYLVNDRHGTQVSVATDCPFNNNPRLVPDE